MVSNPTFIRMLVQYGTFPDWFTNPWHTPDLEVATYTGSYELRKLTVSWARTPTVGVVQDADQCTFHFLNLTGGNPDATWTDSDFLIVENAFNTFWAAINGQFMPETKLSEYLWRADGPAFKPHGDSLSPTLRVVPKSVAGTASGMFPLPPQCAMSVTEVTASTFIAHGVGVPGHAAGTGRTQVRNRWGRFYLPALIAQSTNDGRFASATCTLVSNAVKAMYNTCVAGGIIPVMYSPTTGNSWSINAVHVDDIVDVVRSRRYETPITRAPNTIDAP